MNDLVQAIYESSQKKRNARSGVKIGRNTLVPIWETVIVGTPRDIELNQEYFEKELKEFVEKHPEYYEPHKFLVREIGLFEFPIYDGIKFPSGRYNFFHFFINTIERECLRQISTIQEQVRYLEECKNEFEYFILGGKYKLIEWQKWEADIWINEIWKNPHLFPSELFPSKFGEVVNWSDLGKSKLINDQKKFVEDEFRKFFISQLDCLLKYRKTSLEIEQKYSFGNQLEKNKREISDNDCTTSKQAESQKDTPKPEIMPIEPFHWQKDTALLAYLLESLSKPARGCFPPEQADKIFSLGAKHFIDKNGNPLTSDDLRKAKHNYSTLNSKTGHKPKNAKLVDDALADAGL